MKTGTIRQTVVIRASPNEVYRALTSTKVHVAFTGAPARISGKVKGKFVAWGGYIHGQNLKLVPGKTIVQAWRPSEDSWPKDHMSTVTYRLSAVSKGTKIAFTHARVPAEHVRHLTKGWKESYWDPMNRYFDAQRKR